MRTLNILGSALAVIFLWLVPAAAHADWKRAETERFIVYSQGSEGSLREYARKLETYDWLLRARFQQGDEVPARKLPIYLVDGRNGILKVRPTADERVAGIYIPAMEDVFAIAMRDEQDDVFLHEYVHHFFYQNNLGGGFPAWLTEGMAEYFMTAEIKDRTIDVGRPNEGRLSALMYPNWISLRNLLTQRTDQLARGDKDTYYPVAWVLTHWLMSDDDRRKMLGAYLRAVMAGGDPAEAMETATGRNLADLQRELHRYVERGLVYSRYTADFPEVQVSITHLPPSADALLLLGQRLKVGVPDDQKAATVAEVRRAAARFPDDSFAQLQLGHAELHFGDADAGETILARLLEKEPTNLEALQLMARRRVDQADEATEPERARALIREARGFLTRAFAVKNDDYMTLYLLAVTREGASNYPNANDLETWNYAYTFAPQLPGIRLGYAGALMTASRPDEAIALLEVLANNPHGGEAAAAAEAMIDRARAGAAPLDSAAIDAAADAAGQGETGGAGEGQDGGNDGEDGAEPPTGSTQGP